MVTLAIVLAVFVGISLGLLGGGGSILTVPLLAYVAGMDAKHAIATSLLVVGATSAVGAVSHARAGRVQWRTALLFGATSMVGAYAGGQLAAFIPGNVLLVAFAVIMVATAIAMLRGRRAVDPGPAGRVPVAKLVAIGLALGLVTGTVGAGGGFLVVPALVLLAGVTMPVAVGTSLVVIAMNSFAGLGGYLSVLSIDWTVAGMVTGAAVLGALVGARFAARVDPDLLRKVFGWFVLVMASVIVGEEVHPVAGYVMAAVTAIAAAMTFACNHIPSCPLRRLTAHPVSAGAA